MILIFAGLLAFVGIGAWVYLDVEKNAREKEGRLVTRYIIGKVVDEGGTPIVSANIEVSQDNSFLDKSDGNGRFALEVKGTGKKYLDVVVKHKSYVSNREKVKVDFENKEMELKLEKAIVMQNAFPPDQEEADTGPVNSQNNQSNSLPHVNEGSYLEDDTGPAVTSPATITLKYMGDALDCSLNLIVNIGGLSFNPDSNPFRVGNIPIGAQNYSIGGTISCGYESCEAIGEGTLYIQNNAVYYVMWNYYTCNVGLYNQADYNRLSGL